ncbi:MAG: hypothetical protein IJQ27_00590 [Spirochaetia bacterium]|nr:hypothetical protein [Spirochaetia bacterium]
MQAKDFSRTKIFRLINRCSIFMAVFTAAVFFFYVLGSYQAFLPDTMMLLLRCTVWSSLALIGCSVIVIALLLTFINSRRIFAVKKLAAQIFFIAMAFAFLYVSMFIIACV